jgi:hypothetical protein
MKVYGEVSARERTYDEVEARLAPLMAAIGGAK